MKHLIAICLGITVSFATVAQTGGLDLKQSTSISNGTNSAANNAGNSQSITFTSPQTTQATVNTTVSGNTSATVRQEFGSQVIKNTPSVGGPALTSSNDTCMGAASGSANGPGFGLSFGKTYTDANCVMLKNARELWNMGMKGAAIALMCSDASVSEAFELSGFECPQVKAAKAKAERAQAVPVQRSSGDMLFAN
jgi:hypothetical protein